MLRTTVATSVAALVAAVLVPLSTSAAAADTTPTTPSLVVAGGGQGLSGPASRARATAGRLALATDGSVLVAAASDGLLRVDPTSDRVTVAEPPDPTQQSGAVDVAVLGTSTYLLTYWGLDRIDAAGNRERLWTGSANAVGIGGDGVAWLATDAGVRRVLPDGTATAVPGTEVMAADDLAVSAAGTTAYVLDHAPQRHGIYEVTASGIGARVAGTGYRDDSLRDGQPATAASMESVWSIALDGTTLMVTSHEYQLLASFPIGGSVTVRARGDFSVGVDSARGMTVATQGSGDQGRVVRSTSTGTTRILGVDPDRPWSPDGVRATDAYLGQVRGSAALPGGGTLFATRAGLVREVDADGLLRTRATLSAPLATAGKVATAGDGTAYVVTDTGAVVRVSPSGSVQPVPSPARAADVEVLADGRLVLADAATPRLLVQQGDGSGATTLAALTSEPRDIGLDGDAVLVADTGLRRVDLATGAVTTLLSGGAPQTATRGRDGIWVGQLQGLYGSAMVLQPHGGLAGLVPFYQLGNQAQAGGSGAVLMAKDEVVWRIGDGGAGQEAFSTPASISAGEARFMITRDDGQPYGSGVIRARRGATPPTDPFDGEPVDGAGGRVLRIGGQPIAPGELWSFSVWESFQGFTTSYAAPVTVSAVSLPDTTPPPPPVEPRVYVDQSMIQVQYNDPSAWNTTADVSDFDHSVVRIRVGTVPPSTPSDGVGLPVGDGGSHWVGVPDPVRDQDYAISVFTVDLSGNTSRWTTVQHLDFDPPAPVSAVTVTPSYRSARVQFAVPADEEGATVAYAIAEGEEAPVLPADALFLPTSEVGPAGLSMDTTYTVALWTRDRAGNVSTPVAATFRTLLDSTPPGPVTGLSADGGTYSITARWTNPKDVDFAGVVAELVDPDAGTASRCPSLGSGGASCTWRVKGDASRTVRVRAKDVNGNLSEPVETTATSLADSNGTPVIPEPVTWTPVDPTTVTVRFPKPTYVDLAGLWYVVRPSGETSGGQVGTIAPSSRLDTVAQSITLPDPSRSYDLYLYISDLNGNRGEKVLTGLHGGPDPAGRPSMPADVRVTAPFDNTIKVTWRLTDWGAPVNEWVATASSADGSVVRTVHVPGTATNLGIGDLPGRQSWSVRLYGVNALGNGTASLAQNVMVGDATAPAPVTALASTPAYDAATLRWTNPAAFDLAKVVVLRRDRTSGAVVTLYSGTGTTVRSAGLVPGRSYSYELRSYDLLGNVSLPATLTTTQSTATLGVASTLRYGSAVRASGVLSLAGRPLAGRAVTLYSQRVGSTTWSKAASMTTSSTGAFAFSAKPTLNTRYRVGYAGVGTTGGSYSPTRTVTVSPVVSGKASRTSLYRGGSVTLSTTVSPNHQGRSISLQRWSGTAWVTMARRTLSSTSAASATIRPSARGYNSYRWYLPAHSDHGTGVSSTLRVRVY